MLESQLKCLAAKINQSKEIFTFDAAINLHSAKLSHKCN